MFVSPGKQGSKKHGLRGLSISKLRNLIGDMSCMRCGRGKTSKDLVIHHADENVRNNYLNNLCVICKHCHKEVHQGGNGQVGAHRYRTTPRRYGRDYEERFNEEWAIIGGVSGFRELYGNEEITTERIGWKMGGISRERIRQMAMRLGIPTRRAKRTYIAP